MSDLPDDKLLKRASHAGRNISVLAILATLGAIALISTLLLVKGSPPFVTALAAALSLIAAGYWILAVPARRGNPNAVGLVLVIMILQITLAMISSGVQAARSGTAFQPNIPSLVIPILVIAALHSSRKVLLQLQDRGLWEQRFGSVRPSANLCIIGGAVLASGFIVFNGASFYLGWKVGQAQAVEARHVETFVRMIKSEEQEFISAMTGISATNTAQIEAAFARGNSLEQGVETLKKEAAGNEQFLATLTTYGKAVGQWKNALLLLKDPNPDFDRFQKMLELGDRFRAEAFQEFDRRYGSRKPRAATDI